MNRPRTFVNRRKVPTEGGMSASMNIFGFSSPGMSELLSITITIKNEIKRVTPKKSVAPIIKAKSFRISRFEFFSVCNALVLV